MFPINSEQPLYRNDISKKELIPLEHDLSKKKSFFDLNKEEPITKLSFKKLIESAHQNNVDYIFLMISDDPHKTRFYDGIKYIKWLSLTKGPPTDLETNKEILPESGIFFIIEKDQDLKTLKTIPRLCSLDQFLDPKTHLYYSHYISLADDTLNKEEREILEFNYALDLLLGRGTSKDIKKAVNYIEEKARNNNNNYCSFLLHLCYKYGIGKEKDDIQAKIWETENSSEWEREVFEEAKNYLDPTDSLLKAFASLETE